MLVTTWLRGTAAWNDRAALDAAYLLSALAMHGSLRSFQVGQVLSGRSARVEMPFKRGFAGHLNVSIKLF